jgi:hypothetical protein
MKTCVAFVGLLALTTGLSAAPPRGPSTPEERQKALAVVRHLESDPLAKSAKDERGWLTVWLTEVPDITVTLCTAFYPPLLDSKKNHASELAVQSAYSMAGFLIEHPEKAQDENARYLAGVEGTLRTYESILQKDPKAHWPVLDELLAKRERGELAAFVEATVPKCRPQ